jgi:acyl-CoA synthetase (AMP-forming)/AMP-acid ligase II
VYLEDARTDRVLSYADLRRVVAAWTALFDRLGLPPGAAVLVAIHDPLSFAIVHLAVVSSGRRSVPLDADLLDGEPAKTSELIQGAALVVTDVAADGDGPWATTGINAATGEPVGERKSRLMPRAVATAAEKPPGGAAVLFTSGSTGAPKGVELPEAQLLFVAREIVRNNRLTSSDRGFNSLPLFHVNAQVVGLLSTLVAGAALVLDSSFHRTGFWELLSERRVTWLNAVPAILAVLTRDGAEVPDLGLRFIRSASAPLPDAVRDALGDIPLVLSWGMTEAASQIAATPLGDASHPGSVGLPLGSEVAVRREDGGDAPPGELGALWIRGPGIVSSYLFGAAADRFDHEGWLDTGDLGRIEHDGYIYLQGRSDDVINRGGEKVYPAEVEEVLLGDPRVLEAVVVAALDDVLGSVPKAYVIPVAGAKMGEDDLVAALHARCEAQLPRFKRPIDIEVVTDLPRAPTGKVQRSRVRTLAATGTA